MIELPRKNIQDNFSPISGEKSGSFPPHCKSAFDVTPRQIAWLTVRCRVEGYEGARWLLIRGLVHRCPHVASPPRILIIPLEKAENGGESGEISRRLMRRFISLTFQSIIACSWDLPLSTIPLHRFPLPPPAFLPLHYGVSRPPASLLT